MEKRGKMKHSFFIEGENERISALLDTQKTLSLVSDGEFDSGDGGIG